MLWELCRRRTDRRLSLVSEEVLRNEMMQGGTGSLFGGCGVRPWLWVWSLRGLLCAASCPADYK